MADAHQLGGLATPRLAEVVHQHGQATMALAQHMVAPQTDLALLMAGRRPASALEHQRGLQA